MGEKFPLPPKKMPGINAIDTRTSQLTACPLRSVGGCDWLLACQAVGRLLVLLLLGEVMSRHGAVEHGATRSTSFHLVTMATVLYTPPSAAFTASNRNPDETLKLMQKAGSKINLFTPIYFYNVTTTTVLLHCDNVQYVPA